MHARRTEVVPQDSKELAHMSRTTEARRYAAKVIRALKAEFPEVRTALRHRTPVQLLVATILSAQCTDKQVNEVSRDLFAKYPTAAHLAKVPIRTLEKIIRSTGFFHNKAKNIKACCRELTETYDGEVPQDVDLLVQLPGVGRKTANVVLGSAFALATGVVVDTHVGRVSRRLGLSAEKDPVKVERDLMDVLPKKEWIDFSHRMIYHGRRTCQARKPKCDVCPLNKFCPRIGVAT